jgi:hypothetical protein
MAKNISRKFFFVATNEVKQPSPKGPSLFLLEQGGNVWLFLFSLCSHQVFTRFPKCPTSSQSFHQHVSNSSSLNPISFALNHTLEILYKQPKGGDYNIYIFWDYPKLDFLLSLFFVMDQSKMPIKKEKKTLEVPTINYYESQYTKPH